MKSVQLQIVLKDMYKLEYGILNRTDIRSPFGSVLLNKAENMNNGHILADELRTYCENDIYQIFGLNVLEFLSLPIDVIEDMLLVVGERKEKKDKNLSEIENLFTAEPK